jgi:hypothetical protein
VNRAGAAPPTTGTHVYTWLKCARAVGLDLHGDPALRRPYTEAEEFVLRRGREHEARVVAPLGWATPEYPERDFAAGARATHALLQQGVAGVTQGVLCRDDALGIADLLRREAGASALGDWHYVVGDVKSSRHARSDQVLQVAFYSALLAPVQGRAPAYAYLLLKDGREERFQLVEFEPVLADVVARVSALRADPQAIERPFLQRACAGCRWSVACLAELERSEDLSLVAGMTRGVRRILEREGIARPAALADAALEPLARRTHLEPALLRRLQRGAQAHVARQPLPEPRAPRAGGAAVLAHALFDAFAERVLWLGVLDLASGDLRDAQPAPGDELRAFAGLLAGVPEQAAIWHHGEALPRWHAERARGAAALELERRFVDLAQRLRGAAVFPRPVFGLADHVRLGLGRDPHRHGDAGAAAAWSESGERDRVAAKGRGDLADLAELARRYLEQDGRREGWT